MKPRCGCAVASQYPKVDYLDPAGAGWICSACDARLTLCGREITANFSPASGNGQPETSRHCPDSDLNPEIRPKLDSRLATLSESSRLKPMASKFAQSRFTDLTRYVTLSGVRSRSIGDTAD